jgi:hypothetical protein
MHGSWRQLGTMDKMQPDGVLPPIGQEINARGPVYFDSVVIDNLLEAFMELSAEVWTIRDRQQVLETVLAAQGIDAAALIEAHRPDAAEIAARKAMREAYVARLLAGFLRRTDTNDMAVDTNA